MRARNRKAQVRIPFPVVLANMLVFVAVFGLSYVWLCARCDTLGQEIKQLELAQRDARRRLINEQDRWSNLLAPASLDRALKRHRLAMRLPDETQIVRVRSSGAPAGSLAYIK
jgi:hypothetical protein